MSNIVKALMHNRTMGRTEPLYQYDYGQVLQFVGLNLPVAYEVHFSNAMHGVATTQIGNADGVAIPDTYLTTGQTIYAWVYLHTGEDDGETEYAVTIPVIQRASISNATPTPVQQDAITEAIAALDATVTSAETAITHYPRINNSMWEVWDVTTGAYVSTGVQAEGVDGQDGDDGISPVVSVTDITGGHQVSITDRDGTKTFNVLNGTNGAPGSDGADGVTFTPSVSAEGVISWTNDGGKTNPESVNIKGPAGQNGQDGYSPTATVTKSGNTATISITDKNGTTTATVTDGANGTDGTDGTDAYVYIRYAANEPTSDADMKTTPDAWIGIYSGDAATAPTTYTSYTWYKIKGETGAAGAVQDVQVNGTSVLNQGVANVPIADANNFGTVKVGTGSQGVSKTSGGTLSTVQAQAAEIKAGSNGNKVIVPANQNAATFYGLAKAAGDSTQASSSNAVGTYTEDAKSAIHTMLNGSVSVSGTTPTITALSGIRYVCGEVSTLDITLPASGIVDVVFESGSTPTVLTITPPTGVTLKWAYGFDPTSLEANTTYEINIADGLGVACAWT